MNNDTPIANVASRAKYGAYAYFPGTCDESFKQCKDCGHCVIIGKEKRSRCGKYAELTGSYGSHIDTSTAACKYFCVKAGA